MLGLTRAELKRLSQMCGFLVVLMVPLTMLSSAIGAAPMLTMPASIVAVGGVIAGSILFICGRPMVLCVSVMFVPASFALGVCLGMAATRLY